MSLFKNKWFIAIICLIVAAAIAFFLLPGFYRDESATTTILAVGEFVPAGTKITENILIESVVGAYNLPASTVVSSEKIVGKYAVSDLYPGDFLLENKFSITAPLSKENTTATAQIGKDEFLMTIAAPSTAAVVGGYLTSNSIITIGYHRSSFCRKSYQVDSEDGTEIPDDSEVELNGGVAHVSQEGNKYVIDMETVIPDDDDRCIIIPDCLRNMRIYSVKNADLQDIDAIKKKLDDGAYSDNDKPSTVPAFVTVIVNEEQYKTLMRVISDFGGIYMLYDVNATDKWEKDEAAKTGSNLEENKNDGQSNENLKATETTEPADANTKN